MEVEIFEQFIFNEYCTVHLMDLYPGQPDMVWDFAGWWRLVGVRGFTVCRELVVEGKYTNNFFAHLGMESRIGDPYHMTDKSLPQIFHG